MVFTPLPEAGRGWGGVFGQALRGQIMRASVLTVLVAVALAGCTRTAPPNPVAPIIAYDFEVRRPGGGHTKGQAATFFVEDGTNTVELKDGRLTVNDKSYGTIAGGAKVHVDEAGKVSINGQPRSPE